VALPNVATVDGEGYEEEERIEAAQIRKQRLAKASETIASKE